MIVSTAAGAKMPMKEVKKARETERQPLDVGIAGQPSEARMCAASSGWASGATTWSPLPPSCERLCSFSSHQLKRRRIGPLPSKAA